MPTGATAAGREHNPQAARAPDRRTAIAYTMTDTYEIDQPDLLTPDQRAVLSLVLERDKSYAEVADLLAIPESAVRERAHAALDALARSATPAPAGRNGAASAATTGASSAGRAEASSAGRAEASSAGRAEVAPAGRAGTARSTPALPSSRRGGALLLGGIVLVAVVAIVLSLGGKGSSGTSATTRGAASAASSSASSSSSAAAKAAAKIHIDSRLSLAAFEPGAGGHGEAYVLSDGKRRAFYVAAQGLPTSKGFFYAVWLYNSPSSSAPLGRAPAVGSDGRMEGGGPLPSNAADYAKLIVTRETSTRASHPGPIVLSGSFSPR